MGLEITNEGGDRAYYSIREDKIFLPKKTAFTSDYEYNSTALHELSHATGAQKRLDRDIRNSFGTEKYAYEELVAEISSCFMGEHLTIQMPTEHMENHKAYVQSWIKQISEKPAVLMKAIRDAESSANYLEYQAELISEKEYQKTLAGRREVEPEETVPKEAKVGHMLGIHDREHAIADDIRAAGLRPTSKIVDHMIQLEQIAGKTYTLKEVCDLYKRPQELRLNKPISNSDERLFNKALDGIAQECKGQELARMAAAQAVPVV